MAENDTPQSNAHPPTAPDMLPLKFQAAGFTGVLEKMANGKFVGWVFGITGSEPVSISLFEADNCLLTVSAARWREDVAKLHKGNGACGFEAVIPDVLCDGRLHEVDFRITGTSQSIVPRPLRLLPGRRTVKSSAATRIADAHPERIGGNGRKAPAVKLSVIVNFYNMHREAARTLTSLGRQYQQGIEGLTYEVLCIDNGSSPPMEAEWVASFGPEFRLFKPSKLLPSPCAAINEAATQARGEYLAIMIDGAHLLTPGVIAEAMAAFAESPSAIVAVRYWFVGGDQRWLSAAGYSREIEDRLFARIYWPTNGYRLFSVGAPIMESPTSWLDGLFESNCLFVTAALYDRIGGMDEDFSVPGAGFANLDLFRRATAAEPDVVSIIGEATFHQYHEGTTTNVTDDEKDKRVRAYANAYREIRGDEFEHVGRMQIRFRGRIKSEETVRTMKGTYLPLHMGVTDKIRPGRVHHHFDFGAQRYLQTAYVECGLHHLATWRGAAVGMAPPDLLNIQEIIRQTRPDCIITTSTDDGLIGFLDDVLQLFGLAQTRILRVATSAPRGAVPARVRTIVGKNEAPETLERLDSETVFFDTILVLHAPTTALPADSLAAYAKFVSNGSYLIFLGTVFGQPWLGYSKRWNMPDIKKFLTTAPFKIEPEWERQLLSTCPSGYLHRIDTPGKYDASLDQLDIFESTIP